LKYPREAVDSDLFRVRIAKPARRIVSQYWSIDEHLYSVVPPERVIAVSESAYERRISNVYQFAERFRPVIATDPEKVLRQDPDLLLVSNSARIDFCDLVRTTGIPIYRAFTTFTTLEQIAETIRLTGYLTGEDAAAATEIARFRSEIRRAQARKPAGATPPRILGMGGRYSYGEQTLFHDIAKTLGAINVGAEGGLQGYDSVSTEQIVRWNPEWIIAGADRGKTKEVLDRMLQDPAIAITRAAKDGHIVVLENNVFLPMSPFTTLIVNAIAEAIYE
jgi:iron complex transport system substrate-binding protein